MHKCVNNTIGNVYHLEQMVDNFFPYSQKKLGFDKPVTVIFQSDQDNASKMLGKTAYYDPEHYEIVLYTDNRHPKDVMRSLSHELVHHAQNCRGDFTSADSTSPGYAQEDPHLRKMEREAYEKGNLIFRDFEDLIKTGKINIEIDFSNSGEPKMSLKEWKNAELNRNLMKKWGLLKEEKKRPDYPDLDKDGNKNEPIEDAAKDAEEMGLEEAHCSRVEDDELSERFPGIKGQGTPGKVLTARPPRAEREAAACKEKAMRVIGYQQSVEDALRDPRSMFQVDSDEEHAKITAMAKDVMKQCPDVLKSVPEFGRWASERSLEEDSKEKESEHYGEDESADKREEDRLEHHIDRIEHHLEKLRNDMGFDQHREDDHMDEGIFSPNHYCVHHGGVQHEGKIKMAEAINHNFDKKLNKVTWYDMKLQDGTILEQVAAEDIMVTNASLAQEHMHRVEDDEKESGMHKQSEKDPADYTGTRKREKKAIKALKTGKGLEEATSGKISVREAKEITRRIIERIKKEGK